MSEQLANHGVVKITVHYSELKSDKLLVQPAVCMHIVDSNYGSYVKKSNKDRAIMSFYENQRGDIDYIMPIMTQPCTPKEGKSQILGWEESFILNETLALLLKKELNTILFFEIIDLVPLSFTKYHYERLNENGMQKIAWAFLKVLGPNDIVNAGRNLRLQLYKPHLSRKNPKTSRIEVFHWWSKKSRIPLQASIYVSLEENEKVSIEPALRSMLPFQAEIGSSNEEKVSFALMDSSQLTEDSSMGSMENKATSIKWLRKAGESCKVPTKISMSLEICVSCQILRFSSLGRMLVVGCGTLGQYFIVLYGIPSGKRLHRILAHSDVIYDLDWSQDDSNLLTASADYSVKLWTIKPWGLLATFIHPSFVYAAKFQPNIKNTVVTGCNDHVIRVWTFNKSVQLFQELEGHNASVNTLCWHRKTLKLFSADSIGEIKVWAMPRHSKGLEKFVFDEDLSFPEIKGVSIEKLVHENARDFLILFCGDATVKVIDLSIGRILSCFEAYLKSQSIINGCCSPCGNLLFLCNDNGSVSVWNLETAEMIRTLPNNLHPCLLTSVDYHPLSHMLALSTFEDSKPIYIYTFDESDELETINITNPKTGVANVIDLKKISLKTETESKIKANEAKYLSSKQSSVMNTMYNQEISSDDGFPKLSLKAKIDRYSYENETLTSGKSKQYLSENEKHEPFTAIVTKSGHFDVIAGLESSTESDNLSSVSHTLEGENSNVMPRSSKRSQRRRKLKEMNMSKSFDSKFT